jgi:hypothetical protein
MNKNEKAKKVETEKGQKEIVSEKRISNIPWTLRQCSTEKVYLLKSPFLREIRLYLRVSRRKFICTVLMRKHNKITTERKRKEQ